MSSSLPCFLRSFRPATLGILPPGQSSCASTVEVKQSADISQLIHKVPEVIAHLSTFYHLHPGDLIYTGTPEGVGPVNTGDVLEGAIDGRWNHHADDRSSRVAGGRRPCCRAACRGRRNSLRRYIEAGLWEGITVAEMIERTARRQPGKVAVIHGETRITYEELVQSAKRLASGLSSLGLRPQDRVVVQLPNCPEFVVLYLALNYIGVIPVMALRPIATPKSATSSGLPVPSPTSFPIASARSITARWPPRWPASFPRSAHVVVVGEPGPGQTRLPAAG